MRAMTSILLAHLSLVATCGAERSPNSDAQSPASGAGAADPALEADAQVVLTLKSEGGVKYRDSVAETVAGPLGAALSACRAPSPRAKALPTRKPTPAAWRSTLCSTGEECRRFCWKDQKKE